MSSRQTLSALTLVPSSAARANRVVGFACFCAQAPVSEAATRSGRPLYIDTSTWEFAVVDEGRPTLGDGLTELIQEIAR